MMKKKNNLIFVCIFLIMILLCGCTHGDGQVIQIGSAENGEISDEFAAGGGESNGMDESVAQSANATIRVYVCGAVNSPGVVEIDCDSRVEDALEAAGGFAPNASDLAVNLADWVTDGQMIYFPTVEEIEASRQQEIKTAAGLVNINQAGVEELCTLTGIGESRALDIIAYREANGPFSNCEEIMQVAGIKNSIYEKICDKITVD